MSIRKAVVGLVFASIALGASVVEAQVSRVFVSVNGNDANVCSNISTPCRTFGGGITQVDAEGEVIVIESGSYAGVTITKPVKINVAAGAVAFSGLPITVNVPTYQVVVLRGITLKSATPGTGNGITVSSGDLIVEHSVIDGWNIGIMVSAASRVMVSHSQIRNNSWPIDTTAGLIAGVYVAESELFNNTFTLSIRQGNYGRFSRIEVARGQGGIFCEGRCDITDSRVFDKDGAGIVTDGLGVARLNRVEVTGCLYGLSGDGTFESYGNNVIRSNAANFMFGAVLTPVGLQ
jgi:hypothetical protein